MVGIIQSVGDGQPNRRDDVKTIQRLLNLNGQASASKPLVEDGRCGPATIAAVRAFQQSCPSLSVCDSIVQPSGPTLARLTLGLSAAGGADIWQPWAPPADYADLFDLVEENEGNVPHMYLDSKNKVTVGIGTYLPTAADANMLRFYRRGTSQEATSVEKATDYSAVAAAKPDPAQYPNGLSAKHYARFTKLDMTPSDIGKRWLGDVKSFQKQLPAFFSGFANYPASARQALTDIAYQYGASGAARKIAGLHAAAESGDWTAAAKLCDKLEGQPDRNAERRALFESAAKAAPRPVLTAAAAPS